MNKGEWALGVILGFCLAEVWALARTSVRLSIYNASWAQDSEGDRIAASLAEEE